MNQKKQSLRFFFILALLQFSFAGINPAQESKNLSYLGNYGKGEGQCRAVFAQGTLAYFSVGEKLKIADFSDAANPVALGSLPLPALIEDVVRSGNNAYIIANNIMYIANVQNPLAPSITGSFQFSGHGEGIGTKSTNIFVAAGDGGLRIIDASTATAPVEIAAVDTIGYAEGVSISGDYAYVATGSLVRIINISNPKSPVYAGQIESPQDWYQSVTARGNYAYVCDYSAGLRIFNISNPAAPVLAGEIATGERTARVQLDGNYAYVANGEKVRIIDVSNPAAPVEKGSIAVTNRAVSVWPALSNVYAADLNAGLQCINIADPAAPVISSTISVVPAASGTAYGVFYNDNKAFIAYGSSGLRIVDVTNPSSPSLSGEITFDGEARQVAVKGKYAFVAARDGGVQVINCENPAAPVLAKTIATPRARGITISGNYVYVAASDSGLAVIDVTDPANAEWKASASAIYGEGAAVSGNVAAVSNYSNIVLYDITNPLAPVRKGETGALATGTSGMAVSGNYLYVPDYDTLRIFDISDLNNPVRIYSAFSGASWDGSVVVEGKYAYLAAEEYGVRVYDVSTPASAAEIGFYDATPSVRGIAVNNGTVYSAEKADGLSIYKNDLLTSVESLNPAVVSGYSLKQNFPNPFNPSTNFIFTIAKAGFVTVKVYDVIGREVATLVNDNMQAGEYKVNFDAKGLSSGIYFYQLNADGNSITKKMTLLK